MKSLVRDQHFLQILKGSKCRKFQKAMIGNCDDKVIHTLSDVVHNILKGNVKMSDTDHRRLKRYKTALRKIHSSIKKNRSAKNRRKVLVNQVGGFWPYLAGLALQGLASYGGEKLIEHGYDKLKSLI